MANIVTNPTADQTIQSDNLLPAASNTTQSLGSSSAPWNIDLLSINGGTVICLTGSTDPYGGSIQTAINNLPTSGGVIDARASGVTSVAQGAVDPGSRAVTILLGPGTYTFTSITLRSNLKILGAGVTSTIIQASSSTATALFFGPGSGNVNASWCVLSDFLVYGPQGGSLNPSPANSLDCFLLDASGSTDSGYGGVWNSKFERIASQGFGGSPWHIRGASTSTSLGINQLLHFYACQVYLNAGYTTAITLSAAANASGGDTVYTGTVTGGGSNALAGITFTVTGFTNSGNNGTFLCVGSSATTLTLVNSGGVLETHAGTATGTGTGQAVRVEGANYQLFWNGCFLEGPNGNKSVDTTSGTNPIVFLGGGPGTNPGDYPYGMHFLNTNIEGREVAIQLDGAQDVTFTKGHHEALYGFLLVTYGANGASIPTYGIVVQDSSWNTNVGVNSGSGYIVSLTTANCGGIRIHDNFYNGSTAGPDNWLLNSGSALSYAVTFSQNLTNFSGGSTYGNSGLFGGGTSVPAVVARYDASGQSINISAVTIFTPVASGWYRLTIQEVLTTAAGSSSTLPSVSVTFTDADSSTTQIDQITGTYTGNTVGIAPEGQISFYAKGGTNIQISTGGYMSNPATAMRYALHAVLERMQ